VAAEPASARVRYTSYETCGPSNTVTGASGTAIPSTDVLAMMFTPSG
jgi:hypothetical protein